MPVPRGPQGGGLRPDLGPYQHLHPDHGPLDGSERLQEMAAALRKIIKRRGLSPTVDYT